MLREPSDRTCSDQQTIITHNGACGRTGTDAGTVTFDYNIGANTEYGDAPYNKPGSDDYSLDPSSPRSTLALIRAFARSAAPPPTWATSRGTEPSGNLLRGSCQDALGYAERGNDTPCRAGPFLGRA